MLDRPIHDSLKSLPFLVDLFARLFDGAFFRMPSIILRPFLDFPNEANIIGRLLAGYTTLEVGLLHCVQVIRDDFDAVFKSMFRVRSEGHRIDIADALGRHQYADIGLETQFAMAIGTMRHCMKIRNQYAHCNWYDDYTGKLAFVNLEELARNASHVKDFTDLTVLHVDAPLLEKQEEFFVYADRILTWVNYEGRHRTGKIHSQPIPALKQIPQPPLHIL